MRCAIPTNRQSASLLCMLRLCMRTVSPWLCCAAPGFSGPRWTHSCRRTPEFSDLETTMRYTRPAPKINPSICDHSMEKLPLRCQNKPACSALLPPIWSMAAHRLRVRKQKTTVKAFQKLFCCIFITSPGFRRVKFLLRASEKQRRSPFCKKHCLPDNDIISLSRTPGKPTPDNCIWGRSACAANGSSASGSAA